MRHMGKKFALCGVCPADLFQKLHNRLLLFLSCQHYLRDILMVSVQARTLFFERLIRHTAAADIDFSKLRVIPGVNHFGTAGLQYLPHRFLHHHHIVRFNMLKPMPVALFWFYLIRYAQKTAHRPVRIHPWLASLLQLNRPDPGSGAFQNVFQAPPCLQLVFLFLLHYGVDIPLGKNRTVLFRRFFRGGKMNLQVFQSAGAVFLLIPDGKFLLFLKLRQYIVFFCHGPKAFLIPGDHILGNVPLHCRLIAVRKVNGPIHIHPPTVSVCLTFARIKIHLIDPQIVYAEGMKNIIASLLKLADQVPPFQRGYNKICRSLKHIRRIFQRFHRRIVHTVKADHLFPVIKRNHHKGVNILTFQILILEGFRLPNILYTLDNDMLADAEIPIPACTYLRGNILKILPFRLHSFCRPLIGIIISAGFVLLKDISTFSVQRFPQVLQQHLKRPVRRLLQQCNAKALINNSLQILNALYTAVLLTISDARQTFTCHFQKLP